jgi:hypothetical protein
LVKKDRVLLVKSILGLGLVLLPFLALMIWVRFSPNDPARFHIRVDPVPKRMDGGVVEVIPGDLDTLLALDAIARATPRTALFAGSPATGRVTYITRSAFWGFPDFTTVDLFPTRMVIHARLRFGRKDFGVNSARVADWLQRLEAVQQGRDAALPGVAPDRHVQGHFAARHEGTPVHE